MKFPLKYWKADGKAQLLLSSPIPPPAGVPGSADILKVEGTLPRVFYSLHPPFSQVIIVKTDNWVFPGFISIDQYDCI